MTTFKAEQFINNSEYESILRQDLNFSEVKRLTAVAKATEKKSKYNLRKVKRNVFVGIKLKAESVKPAFQKIYDLT